MRAMFLSCVLAAGLAACGEAPASRQPSDEGLRPGRSAVAASAEKAAEKAVAPVPAAKPSALEEKNERYSFAYRYPAAASAVPQIAKALDQERGQMLEKLSADTTEAKRDADKNGDPYRAYSSEKEWKVVTETPRLLSLSAQGYDYTGGAHGMPFYDSFVWDKRATRRLVAEDMFRSQATLSGAVRTAFCRALDAQRKERRGGEMGASVGKDDPFNTCPKVAESTLLLGSSNRQAIDRLGFVIGPYTAGPYAEGAYELTLPVTPAVIAALNPEYRAMFAAR